MSSHNADEHDKKEGDVSKGLPEVAPHTHNPYEEDDFPYEPHESTVKKLKDDESESAHQDSRTDKK